ncbi:nucleotide-binding protein [Pseudomonas corrugata]|uniref:Nucleotide-binding protein n=1 Tax=Pseudomonas corrugata TaxID=47879 RepID=A0A8B6UKT9_9PSED|nr:TIR domain-containing protein [Pseudomonas corrugata]QTH12516.1 nucleotide-binding protein [Pseudomonas corrugata]
MDEVYVEIGTLITKIEDYISKGEKLDETAIEALQEAHLKVGKSWSGSWIGHHSRIYYENLTVPPPGAHFSSEWGTDNMLGQGTSGRWCEYSFDDVYNEIHRMAGSPDLSAWENYYTEGVRLFDKTKKELEVLLTVESEATGEAFYKTLLEDLSKVRQLAENNFISFIRPKSFSSRDSLAMSQGIMTPPHIKVMAECMKLKAPSSACSDLLIVMQKAFSYSQRQVKKMKQNSLVGTNIFIGHGRSPVWRDLKDFVKDRLGLPYDEFNRVPVAGITNIQRLTQMLESAAVAFVVMTAEDEQVDGTMEARTNVIHEVGLFQGRLGFTKAIILLEEGCQEFSNIQGLGQIRFPVGNIAAKFEEIRLVLEREGLITE